jgi:hypothetical protein
LPERTPRAVLLEVAPVGFDITISIDPSTIGSMLVERPDGEGRELLIADESAINRLYY